MKIKWNRIEMKSNWNDKWNEVEVKINEKWIEMKYNKI